MDNDTKLHSLKQQKHRTQKIVLSKTEVEIFDFLLPMEVCHLKVELIK